MQANMNKQIQKANQAVKEAENALNDAILAERTAKGQSLNLKKAAPQKLRIQALKPKAKIRNQYDELRIEEDEYTFDSRLTAKLPIKIQVIASERPNT